MSYYLSRVPSFQIRFFRGRSLSTNPSLTILRVELSDAKASSSSFPGSQREASHNPFLLSTARVRVPYLYVYGEEQQDAFEATAVSRASTDYLALTTCREKEAARKNQRVLSVPRLIHCFVWSFSHPLLGREKSATNVPLFEVRVKAVCPEEKEGV